MKKSFFLLFIFCCLNGSTISAQIEWQLTDEFSFALHQLDAEVMPPLDGGYKRWRLARNSTQNCHWAIRSRKEKLEIRYLAAPFAENRPRIKYPDMAAHRLAMHICSNEQGRISTRDLTDKEKEGLYNADWGRVYVFPPKLDFSPYSYCKMIALYKEDKGMMYIFNLFDNPSPEIDTRLYSFRFISE